MKSKTQNQNPSPTRYSSRKVLRKWLIGSALGTSIASFVTQAQVFNPQNGHSYAAIPGQTSWADAKQAAEALGGYLATITSADEQSFISNSFLEAKRDGYWLGGFQVTGETNPSAGWEWITGEPWAYTNWIPGGEPNDYGGVNEDKLAFHGFLGDGNPQGYWNDAQPFSSPGYVIEWNHAVPDGGPRVEALLALGVLAGLRAYSRCGSNGFQ